MAALPRRSARSFLLAVAAAWTALLLAAATAALVVAGVPCWLQGSIYLVAAAPLGLGATGVLRFLWFGERMAYRRGLYLLVIGWAVVAHGWLSVRAHRAALLAREEALAPVIEALERYRRMHGAYPASLDALDAQPAGAGRVFYAALGAASYHLGFSHNVLVLHSYDPATRQWRDGV